MNKIIIKKWAIKSPQLITHSPVSVNSQNQLAKRIKARQLLELEWNEKYLLNQPINLKP